MRTGLNLPSPDGTENAEGLSGLKGKDGGSSQQLARPHPALAAQMGAGPACLGQVRHQALLVMAARAFLATAEPISTASFILMLALGTSHHPPLCICSQATRMRSSRRS
mmetsp:Transcript_97466/g.303571  ORF Transcript_97466/g.303571 Transcript_97466/m.303571 type:complete len:109 (+) Transcript_97466:234-560(+)